MLEELPLLRLPTEDDLPDTDGKPVDNELQLLAPGLLRSILAQIWGDRTDWFFGINLGIYYDTDLPAVGPDGFLSLGVPRVRNLEKLRLSYVLHQEKVMPQFVLEIVSRQPGGEYSTKFELYAAIGVLYYVIYNPSYTRRDKHEVFEVYKLEGDRYVRQMGNPVWMPEIGLGIGHEVGTQEQLSRDWLYWYNEQGDRYPAPEDSLKQERELRAQEKALREREQVLREREQLMRREAEEKLDQAQQERRSFIVRLVSRKFGTIADQYLVKIQTLSIEALEALGEALFDFESIEDLDRWLESHE